MKLFPAVFLLGVGLVLGMKEQTREVKDFEITTQLNLEWVCTDITDDFQHTKIYLSSHTFSGSQFQLQPKWYFPLLSPFKIWKFCVDARGPSYCRKHSETHIMGLGCTYWTPPTNTSIFGSFLKYDTILVPGEIAWRKQGTFGTDIFM